MPNAPFTPDATKLSKINLRFLASCANRVYLDKSALGDWLNEQGFDLDNDSFFFSDQHSDTQAFVVGDARKIIVSFRGTEGVLDWQTNAQIIKDRWTDINPLGRVHRGFYESLHTVWSGVEQEIDRLNTNEQRIWLTGHSLGGALAKLAAATLQLQTPIRDVQGVYTFGQPRLGDRTFAKNLNALMRGKMYRFVNNNDIVSRVPPQIFNYSHAGYLYYFDRDGRLHKDGSLSWWARFWDRLEGRVEELGDLDLDVADGIADHSMDDYLKLSNQT